MIYLDSSVALAHLLAEDRFPPDELWEEQLVSSRLLECEVWNRINAHQLQNSHGDAVRNLIGRIAMVEMIGPVLTRTLQPFPVPVRTLDSAAISSCQHTVRVNKLSDRVSVYQSDNLKSIPRSELWNLVVSNPPHFIDQYEGDIRAHDPDWRIHRNFFETISDHLAVNGVIVLQENNRGSIVETFRPMIEQSGFEIFFTHGDYSTLTKGSSSYFIGIGRRGPV